MVKAEKIVKQPEECKTKASNEDEEKEKGELRKSLELDRKKIDELEKALKASLQRQNVANEQNNMVNREKDLLISQLTLLLREFKTRLEKAEVKNDQLKREVSSQNLFRNQQQHSNHHMKKSKRRWTTLQHGSNSKSNKHHSHKLEIRSRSQERLEEKRTLGVPYFGRGVHDDNDDDDCDQKGNLDRGIEIAFETKKSTTAEKRRIQIGSAGVSELLS